MPAYAAEGHLGADASVGIFNTAHGFLIGKPIKILHFTRAIKGRPTSGMFLAYSCGVPLYAS